MSLEVETGRTETSLEARIVRVMGSWTFVKIQTALLLAWLILNTLGPLHWLRRDPQPFILLNLLLSFQAAYAGPLILMASNRQEARDRALAQEDDQILRLTRLEVEQLLAIARKEDPMPGPTQETEIDMPPVAPAPPDPLPDGTVASDPPTEIHIKGQI